uniref:(northern house mosquito) hypothetical protein n=2 Tax=Culex pipiens TaxID=7175 RepID=A0A8D8F5G8_CULPI
MATGMNDYNSRKRFAFDVDMEIETEPTSRIKAGQGNESPGIHVASGGGGGGVGAGVAALSHSQENLVAGGGLPNEISAPYEVPQFPIEQIENKLQLQRQLNAK